MITFTLFKFIISLLSANIVYMNVILKLLNYVPTEY